MEYNKLFRYLHLSIFTARNNIAATRVECYFSDNITVYTEKEINNNIKKTQRYIKLCVVDYGSL